MKTSRSTCWCVTTSVTYRSAQAAFDSWTMPRNIFQLLLVHALRYIMHTLICTQYFSCVTPRFVLQPWCSHTQCGILKKCRTRGFPQHKPFYDVCAINIHNFRVVATQNLFRILTQTCNVQIHWVEKHSMPTSGSRRLPSIYLLTVTKSRILSPSIYCLYGHSRFRATYTILGSPSLRRSVCNPGIVWCTTEAQTTSRTDWSVRTWSTVFAWYWAETSHRNRCH